jgi:hypothetical protein
VLINRPNGVYTITYASGDLTVLSLVSEENMVLSGGTLSVAQPSFWNQTLQVAGGTLAGSGDKTIRNLILSSGSILGSGDVTVTSAFTQSAGIIDIGGALSITQSSGTLRVAAPLTAASTRLAATDTSGEGMLDISGPVSSSGTIELVSSGGIDIHANVSSATLFRAMPQQNLNVFDATVSAPRIELTFPSPSLDYFVNGTRAMVASGSAGFFSGGVPAVLGSTLAVSYGETPGGESPPVPPPGTTPPTVPPDTTPPPVPPPDTTPPPGDTTGGTPPVPPGDSTGGIPPVPPGSTGGTPTVPPPGDTAGIPTVPPGDSAGGTPPAPPAGNSGGPSPVASNPVVVTATNQVVEATTRVFDPMNLLGADDGTSQFKVQSDAGAAIVDPAARETKAQAKECR